MKRCYILLLLCLSFVMTACSTSDNEPSVITDVFTFGSTFLTEEEYNAFLAENTSALPERYTSWSQVSQLGEITMNWVSGEELTQQAYVLTDKTGLQFYLYIDYNPTLSTAPRYFYYDAEKGGRLFTGESCANISGYEVELYPARMERESIHYQYRPDGKIERIIWYEGKYDPYTDSGPDIEFSIVGRFGGFPDEIPADSLVGRLLSFDDAVFNAAFAEITEKLSK